MTDKDPTADFTNDLLTVLMERAYQAGFRAAKEIYQVRIRGVLNASTTPQQSAMDQHLELIARR